jgi:hypothetical protein
MNISQLCSTKNNYPIYFYYSLLIYQKYQQKIIINYNLGKEVYHHIFFYMNIFSDMHLNTKILIKINLNIKLNYVG